MTAKLSTLAVTCASELGTSLDPSRVAALTTWLSRLETWNARMNLTAARTQPELVDLMLADALVLTPRLSDGANVVDVGTGAGAPGLALALLHPGRKYTLVEPLGKRASFLRSVMGELALGDVIIERTRGEALRPHAWDVAVSRATLPPDEWLDLGLKLVTAGGIVWVLVAGDDTPRHPGATLETDFAYKWPLTGVPRRALGYRRSG